MNRAVSLRSSKGRHDTSAAQNASKTHRFTFGSLRGNMQPQLSKRLYKLIKTENVVISVSIHQIFRFLIFRHTKLLQKSNRMWLDNFHFGEKRREMILCLIFLTNLAFS